VYDTGLSINQVVNDLKKACKKNTPEIRIATPYFKPNKNKTDRKPNYYIHETDKWLVFPHELDGLTVEELKANKPELGDLVSKISHIIEEKNST
jgi:hypoxanthine phosphoribosyltransferase